MGAMPNKLSLRCQVLALSVEEAEARTNSTNCQPFSMAFKINLSETLNDDSNEVNANWNTKAGVITSKRDLVSVL